MKSEDLHMTNTPQDTKKTKKAAELSIDASAVKQLADLFKETDLSEIEYETEGCRIRVARQYTVMPHTHTAFLPSPLPAPSSEAAENQKAVLQNVDPSSHPGAIKSPMVGTVYLSPQPGAAPFVKVGEPIKEGDTIMIVEAMKVMNPIRAPRSGVVKEIFVQDATPVEYDDLLLIIE